MKQTPIQTFRGGPNIDPEAEVLPEADVHVYAVPLSANEEAELRAELERANAREAAARDRAELLEANVHDLRQALEALSRALPPGPQPPAATVSQAPRRRWWSSK